MSTPLGTPLGTRVFADGGYRYVEGVFQYSGGVAAQPGHAIERAVFDRALPLAAGFEAIQAHLGRLGRDTTALCALELRIPEPLSDEGFLAFNRDYVGTLERWGLIRDGVNPVARTNVCPAFDPPAGPVVHAFSYTVPSTLAHGGFIVAGSGEAPEGRANYRDHVIRPGDTSAEGLREKVRFVMAEMGRRLGLLGMGWHDATSVQAYTVADIGFLMHDELVATGAARHGLCWHHSRPPVAVLDYEMDVRGPTREHHLRA